MYFTVDSNNKLCLTQGAKRLHHESRVQGKVCHYLQFIRNYISKLPITNKILDVISSISANIGLRWHLTGGYINIKIKHFYFPKDIQFQYTDMLERAFVQEGYVQAYCLGISLGTRTNTTQAYYLSKHSTVSNSIRRLIGARTFWTTGHQFERIRTARLTELWATVWTNFVLIMLNPKLQASRLCGSVEYLNAF